MAVVISWGKPNLLYAKYTGSEAGQSLDKITSKFTKVDTPVNGTTSINVEDGEKHEAEIEGGQVEAVKYDADKFQLQFDIRRAAGRKVLANDKDGVIAGTYAFVIQPEDPSAPAVLIEATSLKKSPNYASADGLTDHYVADVLVPSTGNSIKIGTASADGTKNTISAAAIAAPKSADSIAAGGGTYVTFYEEKGTYLDAPAG